MYNNHNHDFDFNSDFDGVQQKYTRRRQRRGGAGRTVLLVFLAVIISVVSGVTGGFVVSMVLRDQRDAVEVSEFWPPDAFIAEYRPATVNTPEIATTLPEREIQSLNTTPSRMTAPEVAAIVSPSVVEIKTETVTTNVWRMEQIREGAGSGVIVSADGYIITNAHVIEGARSVIVRLYDGQEHAAQVIGSDVQTDIAVLKIEAAGLMPAVFGNSSNLLVAESVLAVGNPLGELGGTVTAGIISALDREIIIDGQRMTLLQMDAAVNPGNSGGGLFNFNGELIGVVNAKSGGLNIEGLGFAIPINTARAVMTDILDYGFVRGRLDTGLTLVDIQTANAAMMHRVNQMGLYISRSVHNQFQSGDRITAVGARAVSSLADFNAVVNDYNVGDVVSITVVRGNQSVTHEIMLAELR